MKRLIHAFSALLLATPLLCQAANCNDTLPPDTVIEPVGYYSNPVSDLTRNRTPFVYFVQLWHAGACYFGEFAANNSLDGEGKRGFIDGFTYDPKTHATHFTAKLRIGAGTKDFFEFSGQFDTRKFSGAITYTEKSSDEPPATAKVKLALSKDSRVIMKLDGGGNTYAAWRKETKYGPAPW